MRPTSYIALGLILATAVNVIAIIKVPAEMTATHADTVFAILSTPQQGSER